MPFVGPKVTIAMSVYNVADYVRASLDCVLSQTFREFELLCIDDASTDGTWEILEEYARCDDRIRLLRQKKNQGLSVSRNRAIAEARGGYLLMLDGDDLFAPDMVENAYIKAKEMDADMVLWDYCVFYQDEELKQLQKQPSSLIDVDPQNKVALLRRPAFTWVKLIRTDKLHELGIHFPEGLTKQDIPVWWQLVTNLDKISILPARLSYYRQQPNNTTNRKDRSVFSLAYVMDITKRQLGEDGLYLKYREEFLRSRLSLLQGMYDFIKPALKDEALELIKERLGEDEIAYIHQPDNALSERTRNFYGMIEGNWWKTFKYNTFLFVRSLYRMIKN